MKNLNLNDNNSKSLLEKISSIIILNKISNFLNNQKKYIIPYFLSSSNNNKFNNTIETKSNLFIEENEKIEIKKLITLMNFYKSCRQKYKEYVKNKEAINDPIEEIYNRIEKPNNNIILNYNKYFYYFLMNVPYINISPFCSLMNIIYFNEYYKKIKYKKQKIVNLILYLNDEIAKSRINDILGEMILKSNDYIVKKKNINFNGENFLKIVNDLYKIYDEPIKIIVNSDNKNIKQNFKNKENFIIDGILFKLTFKSNSLLIIHRV